MKKLIAIFAVLLLAAPAMAADWSFYGSQRVATFYVAEDYGDFKNGAGDGDDWGLEWNFQGNSRLGARVKADKVSGLIELAMRAPGGKDGLSRLNATQGGDGGDDTVNTRRAFAVWKFADNAWLKVGKDYGPTSNLVFGQVFGTDDGLLGDGDFYGKRPGGLTLGIGGFELALLANAAKDSGSVSVVPAGSDIGWNIPKIEARYTLTAGGFTFIPFGGFQYFNVDEGTSILTDDLDIYSYVIGGVAKMSFGAFYVNLEGAWGQNWSNANWDNGFNTFSQGASSANRKGTNDVYDSKSWLVGGAVGMNFTPTLKFELGAGYRRDDADIGGVDEVEGLATYLQTVITLAPGVYLVPEVGYYHYFDDPVNGDDLGYTWYAGAKWQIDF